MLQHEIPAWLMNVDLCHRVQAIQYTRGYFGCAEERHTVWFFRHGCFGVNRGNVASQPGVSKSARFNVAKGLRS